MVRRFQKQSLFRNASNTSPGCFEYNDTNILKKNKGASTCDEIMLSICRKYNYFLSSFIASPVFNLRTYRPLAR